MLPLWIFSEAASNRSAEANSLLNDFCELDKIKLSKPFLPSSFCVCAIGKSSASLLVLLRVINSETSKLLRRAILGYIVVVDT